MTAPSLPAFLAKGKLQQPIALLLDVDGTLLDFAPHPDAVHVPPELIALLAQLHTLLDGALALVSGRELAVLDRLFAPLHLASAGLHGLERRLLADATVQPTELEPLPPHLIEAIKRIVAHHKNSFIEAKGYTLAVHHRLMPDSACVLYHQLQDVCQQASPGWGLMRGRQVIEFKPHDVTKGSGVEALLETSAFRQRLPVSFGDDITDLDMFAAVSRHGGVNISVGPRLAGAGHHRLAAPRQTLVLLGQLAAALASPNPPQNQLVFLQQLLHQA